MNYKQFSFLLPIETEFLSEKITTDVYVTYRLFWDYRIQVVRTSYVLGIPEKITNWEGLNEAIKTAAEKDGKKFAPPGKGRPGRMSEDPREVYELEQRIK
jgi:hypothetical protein